MRALIWSLRILVFLVLFAFAVKNTDTVAVRLFFGAAWQVPLIVALFVFFLAGVLAALLAVAGPFVRLRRELAAARKQIAAAPQPAPAPGPLPDGTVDRLAP